MALEHAAPCHHPGAPSDAIVDRVVSLIASLARDASYLAANGISAQEFTGALPAAIQRLRGSDSASNSDQREHVVAILAALRERGLITRFDLPRYGEDTVYRLHIPGFGSVAIIQKGCPDGAHSSVRWSRPEWAREAYLWWACSSESSDPGTHIWKGVGRLRQRFFSNEPGWLDGVIFHNELCGSPRRPCPKSELAIEVVPGRRIPPPCVYVMPNWSDEDELNWTGSTERRFPAVLLALWGIQLASAPSYTGYVGFQRRAGSYRTTIASRFGPGRTTSHRS
jgi:hypothetical protein